MIWNFGFITNLAVNNQTVNDTIRVTYIVRILDHPDNYLDRLVWYDPRVYTDANVISASRKHYLKVMEPQLQITSSASPDSGIDSGDLLNYTFLLRHVEMSSEVAFRLVWQIAIPRVNLTLYNWTVDAKLQLGNVSSSPDVRVIDESSEESSFGPGYDVIICKMERMTLMEGIEITFVANTTQSIHASQKLPVPSTAQFSSLPYDLEPLSGRIYNIHHSQYVRYCQTKLRACSTIISFLYCR